MSEDLYPVRVFFNGHSGCVKTPGVYRHITAPPEVPGLPQITSIDYAPGVCCLILPHMGELRDLTPTEIGAIGVWLDGIRGRK